MRRRGPMKTSHSDGEVTEQRAGDGLEVDGGRQAGSLWYETGWKPVPRARRGMNLSGMAFQWDGLPVGWTSVGWTSVGWTSSPSRSLAFQANIPALPS